uniref:Reverse transcriptase domain-containing protein n=1 Tax=Ananas comosus var. bracteatus TaxID=296719 RepID=A0A6V7PH17_ANACO|nr:unnamed protein product [Ananas comosus var. bracteatus]
MSLRAVPLRTTSFVVVLTPSYYPCFAQPSVPAATSTETDRGKGVATKYRRRGRSSTRDRTAPHEMPEQAEPNARPELDSWIIPADLLVLGQRQDFDVVLCMDWLAQYYATFDCGARTVTFHELGQKEFTFRGCRKPSVLAAASTETERGKGFTS